MSLLIEDSAIELAASMRELLVRLARCDRDLATQIRRATSSVALNVAEGMGRIGKDRLHHYRVAKGSALEVKAGLRLAVAFGYVSQTGVERPAQLSVLIQKLLSGLLR